MKICSRYHDEVCFEGRDCPVCALVKTHEQNIAEFEQTIQSKNFELEEMSDDIERIGGELAQANKDLTFTRDGQRDGQR